MSGTKNWKRAFFTLLGLLVAVCVIVIGTIIYLVLNEPQQQPEFVRIEEGTKPFFTLTTSKSAINSWIQDELEMKGKTIESFNYDVVLEDYIYLNGGLLIFNREIPFQMVFHPIVNKNGGLTLQEREISLGMLQLPGQVVLGLIDEQIEFPDWVTVMPSSQEIIVDVTEIKLEKGLQLSIKEFNLAEDLLEFNLHR